MKTVCSIEEGFLVLSQRFLELQGPSCSGSRPPVYGPCESERPQRARSTQPAALTSPVPAHKYPGTRRQGPGSSPGPLLPASLTQPRARHLLKTLSIKSGAKWAFSDPASPSMGVLVHPGGVTKHHTPRSS